MRTEERYHRAQEVWIYDQLQPEEKLFVGRKPPREIPAWAIKFPEHLIHLSPPERTEQEILEMENLFLAKHGII